MKQLRFKSLWLYIMKSSRVSDALNYSTGNKNILVTLDISDTESN
jgi:hypothetical protein